MSKSAIITDSFFNQAARMRSEFEDRFHDPRRTNSDRFIWDYWHVPGQYTALRTPAYHFFAKKLYEAFHQRLVWWGRRNLGCHDISPPWMSCYIEGCKQELHGDLPHGPWAFVYSLTPWRARRFTGGETIMLRDEILSYWSQNIGDERGLERANILREIQASFNRLTVFDPRIPHGVKEVRGVHDVLDGRLVIHGWFVQPRPFIEGSLKISRLQSVIDGLSEHLNRTLATSFSNGLDVRGMMAVRFSVTTNCRVSQITPLANTLRASLDDRRAARDVARQVRKFLSGVRLERQRKMSRVTLPLIFS